MPTLIQALRRALAAHADALALEGDTWLLTYRDLDRESARLCTALKAAGVGPGHRVPMLMRRSPQFVIGLLAIVRCGAAYVPLDPSWPPVRRDALLRRLDAPAGLVDAALSDPALGATGRVWLDPMQAAAPGDAEAHWPLADDEHPLYVMFTSGSTGEPKGVVIPHRGVRRLVCDADYADFRPGARWAFWSAVAFDASTLEVWAPLLHGATCVVQESEWPSLDELAAFVADRGLTDVWLTAALFNVLVDERRVALRGLRQVLTGGERGSPAHLRRFLEGCPGVRLINGYGPTENTTFSLCHTVGRDDTDNPTGIPIGRPIAGTRALVVQPDGVVAPAGTVGELWVGGDGVALGYLDDESRTAERFVSRDGHRYYRTGDRVRERPDGVFEYLGREDRQVKVRGHRIELDEVERLLLQAPGVGDAVVWVEGDAAEQRRLVAAYGVLPGSPSEPDSVIRWLSDRLPAPSVPQQVHALPDVPRNLSGKVDREAVRQRLAALVNPAGHRAAKAWNTITERRLAEVWQRQLNVEVAGPDSDFAALGGSSLTALRVAHEASAAFGRALDPTDVLRHPVLADMARAVDSAPPAVADPSDPLSDALRLTRVQDDIVAASRLDTSGVAYLVHQAWHLQVAWRGRRLRALFEGLAARHPLLRSDIAWQGQAAAVRVLPRLAGDWFVEHADVVTLGTPRADGGGVLEGPPFLRAAMARPLPPAASPMRVDVWPEATGGQLVVWTVHHAVIDDASLAIAQRELAALAARQKLPPVYGSPFAFVALERAWTDLRRVDRQARRVVAVLRGQRPPLPAPPGAGRECPVPIPEALAARLAQRATEWGDTLFVPLLVAWGLALQQVFGPSWRHVLTPFTRRLEPETIEPVGCLLDLRLIEAGADAGEDLPATIERVRGEVGQALGRNSVPLGLVAEAVGRLDAGLRAALTQFAFTWRVEPLPAMQWGTTPVRTLPVPQDGARFAACLHAQTVGGCLTLRLEALDAAYDQGLDQALHRALLSALEQVARSPSAREGQPPPRRPHPSNLPGDDQTGPTVPPAVSEGPAMPADPALQLARLHWNQVLGNGADGQPHFLRAGGSSLLALKLAAGLRAAAGVDIDIAAFLRRPTLAALADQLRAPRQPGGRHRTWIGPQDAARIVLVVPGYRGSALGMFRLADALYRRLPPGHAVVIADLRGIVASGPEERSLDHLHRQLEQMAVDLGASRIRAILGYSMGGLLALRLALWLPATPAVWMLDAYSHEVMDQRPARRLLRAVVSVLRAPAASAQRALRRRRRALAERTLEQDAVTQGMAARWRSLLQDLAGERPDTGRAEAVLVRSEPDAHRMGLVRRAGTNGWAPRRFLSLRVASLPIEHEGLRQDGADRVAEVLVPDEAA